MRTLTLRGAAGAIGVLAPLCAASAAHAQSPVVQATVTPAYTTDTGGDGWYRVPINVTFACVPQGLLVGECPGPMNIGAPGLKGPFAGTARFSGAVPTAVGYALLPDGSQVKGVDTVPPVARVSRPEQGATYDAGSVVSASYGTEGGGLSPETAVGPVASGAAFDTGTPTDPATWGARTFTVTAADAAGNAATPVSVTYTITDLPKAPTITAPADRATIGTTPVLQWAMPADDGVGTASATVEVRGPVQLRYRNATSPFTVPALPVGRVSIRVITVDEDGHEAPSSFNEYTVAAARPAATGPAATPGTPPSASPSPSAPATPAAVAAARTLPRLASPSAALPTYRARLLRPRAGARVAARPTLRWPRVKGATLYNVQVYRLYKDGRFVKVMSAFPRTNRLRMPPRRLVKGTRYAWRIWPYMGSARRYKTRPIGVSWFRRVR